MSRAIATLAGLLAITGCSSGSDEAAKVALVDPATTPYGKTYGQWGAEWYRKSLFEVKLTGDACFAPFVDATGERCAEGQDPASPVFFLHGTSGGSAVREKCPVPRGKALFFPLLCSAPFSWAPVALDPSAQLEAAKQWIRDVKLSSLRLEVDGVAVTDFTAFRDEGTPATGTLPVPNNLSCEGGPDVSGPGTFTSVGYWVMLPPPAPGKHEIHFAGAQVPAAGEPFTLDVTYRFEIR